MTLCLLLCPGLCDAVEGSNPDYPASFTVPLQFPELEMIDNGDGTTGLFMEGYPSAREIGLPALPSRVLAIALPPGTEAAGVAIESMEWYEVPGSYTIEWGQEPLPSYTMQAETTPVTQADAAVYSSDAVFPEQPVFLQGTGTDIVKTFALIAIGAYSYAWFLSGTWLDWFSMARPSGGREDCAVESGSHHKSA